MLSLLTFYALANSETPLIIHFENIFADNLDFIQDMKISLKNLTKKMKSYFKDLFNALSLCFEPETLNKDTIKQKGLPISQHVLDYIENDILLKNFVGPLCSYCHVAKEKNPQNLQLAIRDKKNNIYRLFLRKKILIINIKIHLKLILLL